MISNGSAKAGGLSFLGGEGCGSSAEPFDDLAGRSMPKTLDDAFRWAQFVHTGGDATYARGVRWVAAYFITDVDIRPRASQGKKTLTDEEAGKWEQYCRKVLRLRRVLLESAENVLVYGIDLISLMEPFRRSLSCPGCRDKGLGSEFPLDEVVNSPAFDFRWKDFEFHAHCPVCKYRGAWVVRDRRCGPEADLIVRRWSPLEIEIEYDKFRGERTFIWKIPADYRAQIKAGDLHVLRNCNKEVLAAIKANEKLIFEPGQVHATIAPMLAGLDTKGWPIPPAICNYRQIWHAQTLRRMTEAIAQDHIVPHKVIFPAPRGGDPAADPVFGSSLSRFVTFVRGELKRREKDPNHVSVLPFPIEQVILGGDANQIAPYQLTEQVRDDMLNAAGVPAELYKGTLSLQSTPGSLRLFEAQWAHLVDGLGEITQYLVERTALIRNWEPVDAVLIPVTIADNVQETMAKLQLMMGGQVSQTTGMRPMGVDFRQEQDRLASEQKYVAKKQEEAQQEAQGRQGMAQMAQPPQPGQPQQPGQPGQAPAAGGGGGGSGGMGLEEVAAKAKDLGDQIAAMPDTQRTSELMNLKKTNPILHALVKAHLDEVRQQAQTSGGAQVMAQQYGKQGSTPRRGPSAWTAMAQIRGDR